MVKNLPVELMAYQGPIDPTARIELEELQQPGEESLYQAVLIVFLKGLDDALKSLLDYAGGNRNVDTTSIAHSWKSSSYSLGAKLLSYYCAELERLGATQFAEKEDLIEKIREEYLTVKIALDQQRQG